jgi:hypothetical protein
MPTLPTRKVARGTNKSAFKYATSEKVPVETFGGLVTQRKSLSPPASPPLKANSETWASMCDEEAQEENMSTCVNIIMEVDSAEAEGNQLYYQAVWVGVLRPSSSPPATKDRSGVVHISRRRKQKIEVPPEALAIFFGQQLTMRTNIRCKNK